MTTHLVNQVRAYCLRHKFFEPGLVVIAVSGGADSLTLLSVLLTLRNDFDLTLHVATFDHQIRGEASAADTRFVKETAAEWKVPCTVGSANVPELARQWKAGLEAAARKARYAFLAEVAAAIGADTVATGHNLDDQAETVLMHILHGTGLVGLRGMLPKAPLPDNPSMILVRPLLNTSRFAIDLYLKQLGIQPRIDQSNADISYMRNRIRHLVMPALKQANPAAPRALRRLAEIAREDYEALQAALPPLQPTPSGYSFDQQTFLKLSVSQQRALIRNAVGLLAPTAPLTFRMTDQAVTQLASAKGAVRLCLIRRITLVAQNGVVEILREPRPKHFPDNCPFLAAGAAFPISGPGVLDMQNGWQFLAQPLAQAPHELLTDPLSVILVVEKDSRLVLRTRQPGDRFKPHGMRGRSQKLQDALVNMKVPVQWRDQLPVLTINDEIAWFLVPTDAGLRSRIAEPYAVGVGETRPLWKFGFQKVDSP